MSMIDKFLYNVLNGTDYSPNNEGSAEDYISYIESSNFSVKWTKITYGSTGVFTTAALVVQSIVASLFLQRANGVFINMLTVLSLTEVFASASATVACLIEFMNGFHWTASFSIHTAKGFLSTSDIWRMMIAILYGTTVEKFHRMALKKSVLLPIMVAIALPCLGAPLAWDLIGHTQHGRSKLKHLLFVVIICIWLSVGVFFFLRIRKKYLGYYGRQPKPLTDNLLENKMLESKEKEAKETFFRKAELNDAEIFVLQAILIVYLSCNALQIMFHTVTLFNYSLFLFSWYFLMILPYINILINFMIYIRKL